jgi:SAM-dependent methyltransferase
MGRDRPRVHGPAWTPDQVTTFWDNYQSIPHFQTRWFSLTCGPGIVDFADRYAAAPQVILDYGCGRGDLTALLLGRGHRCMGTDSSPANVRAVAQRFDGQDGFLGAFQTPVLSLPAKPEMVFLIEVVEHMPRAAATETLRATAALLPTGGHVLVSCPNREDIRAAEVLCPECACCFHPVQHVQSLAPDDVAEIAADAGFDTMFAGATRFRRSGETRFTGALLAVWYRLIRRSPHLVFVGRKR